MKDEKHEAPGLKIVINVGAPHMNYEKRPIRSLLESKKALKKRKKLKHGKPVAGPMEEALKGAY